MDKFESDDAPIYLVDDFQDYDSDMDSVHTGVSELTEYTMSTLTSDSMIGMSLQLSSAAFY